MDMDMDGEGVAEDAVVPVQESLMSLEQQEETTNNDDNKEKDLLDEDEINEEGRLNANEDKQMTALKAVKQSILKRKKRAARIRKALSKSNTILKIKFWQTSLSSHMKTPKTNCEVEPEALPMSSPSPSPPPRSPTPTPSPPPMSHRFSPDITQYRRKPLLIPRKSPVKSPSSKSSSSGSDSEVNDDEQPQAEGSEDLNSVKSVDSSVDSEHKGEEDSSLLLGDKGDPVVQLDASFVDDFLQSGKPIRAAALAALEAVHGKKISEVEALQRLRKAYIAKPTLPKGRGRRSIFKKNSRPTRGPKYGNWCTVVKSLTYRNSYFQVGDIVFVYGEDQRVYFLQIHSLLMDTREYEGYASMLWLTPKSGFKGPRFPFYPQNYSIRHDIAPLDCGLDNVCHVMHCPMDYFDGHPSFWQPEPGTIYQRLGEPLVKWELLTDGKKKSPDNADESKAGAEEMDDTEVNDGSKSEDSCGSSSSTLLQTENSASIATTTGTDSGLIFSIFTTTPPMINGGLEKGSETSSS